MLRNGDEVVIEGEGWTRALGVFVTTGSGEPHDVPAENGVVTLREDARRTTEGESGYDEFKIGTTVQLPLTAIRLRREVEAEERAAIDHDAEAVRCAANAESALSSAQGAQGLESMEYGVIAQSWATLALAHRTAEQTALVRAGEHLPPPTRDTVL